MSRLWYVALPLATLAGGGFLIFFSKLSALSAKIEDEHRAEEKLYSTEVARSEDREWS